MVYLFIFAAWILNKLPGNFKRKTTKKKENSFKSKLAANWRECKKKHMYNL